MVTRKDALRGRAQDALRARRDLDLPAAHKGLPNQPGYRVRLDGIEVGAPVSIAPISPRGRSMRRSRARGAADDLRQSRRAGGQTPPRVFALIWNLHLESLRRASQHATVLHERVQQPTRGLRSGRRGADAPRSARWPAPTRRQRSLGQPFVHTP